MAATTYTVEVFTETTNGYVRCSKCGDAIFKATGVTTEEETWAQYLRASSGDFSCSCTVSRHYINRVTYMTPDGTVKHVTAAELDASQP